MNMVVVGAGIGGLTAALSLKAAGIDRVQVLESAARIEPLGVGINVLPHAVRELAELGLADQLETIGVRTAELAYYDRHGSRIWAEPRGLEAGYHWPQYSVHRGHLQLLLLNAVRERLGADAVTCGARVRSVRTDGEGATVQWGSPDDLRLTRADVVVAADGIHSTVRAERAPRRGRTDLERICALAWDLVCAPLLDRPEHDHGRAPRPQVRRLSDRAGA